MLYRMMVDGCIKINEDLRFIFTQCRAVLSGPFILDEAPEPIIAWISTSVCTIY